MRCSSRVTVYHIKRFLLQKLCVPALYDVSHTLSSLIDCTIIVTVLCITFTLQLDVVCDENVLHKDSTLKFIWISHWLKKVEV